MFTEEELNHLKIKDKEYLKKINFNFITHSRVLELKQEMMKANNRFPDRKKLTESGIEDKEYTKLLNEEAKLLLLTEEDKAFYENFIKKILISKFSPKPEKKIFENKIECFGLNNKDLKFEGKILKFDTEKYSTTKNKRFYFYTGDIEKGNDSGLIYTSPAAYLISIGLKNSENELICHTKFKERLTTCYVEKKLEEDPLRHKPIKGKLMRIKSGKKVEIFKYKNLKEKKGLNQRFYALRIEKPNTTNVFYGVKTKEGKIIKGVMLTEKKIGNKVIKRKSVGSGFGAILNKFWTLNWDEEGNEVLTFTRIDMKTKEKIETRSYESKCIEVFYKPELFKNIPFYSQDNLKDTNFHLGYGDGYDIMIDDEGKVTGAFVGFHSHEVMIEGFSFNYDHINYGIFMSSEFNSEETERKIDIIIRNELSLEKTEKIEESEKMKDIRKKLKMLMFYRTNPKNFRFFGLSEYFNNNHTYFGKMDSRRLMKYGEFKDNNGLVYKGEFKNGLREGKGELQTHNGDIYKGEFKENQYSGYGEYTCKETGNVYKGGFKNGVFHGKGTYILSNGSVLEETYSNGKLNGVCILQGKDGSFIKGEYKDDAIVKGVIKTPLKQAYLLKVRKCLSEKKYWEAAFWTLRSINPLLSIPSFKNKYRKYGMVYEGRFLNDLYHGYGRLHDVLDCEYKGEFKNGKREGYGVKTYPCGMVFKGIFKNDVPDGLGKFILENGDKIIGKVSSDESNNVFCDGVLINTRGGRVRGIFKDGKIYQVIIEDDDEGDGDGDGGDGKGKDGESYGGRDAFFGWEWLEVKGASVLGAGAWNFGLRRNFEILEEFKKRRFRMMRFKLNLVKLVKKR